MSSLKTLPPLSTTASSTLVLLAKGLDLLLVSCFTCGSVSFVKDARTFSLLSLDARPLLFNPKVLLRGAVLDLESFKFKKILVGSGSQRRKRTGRNLVDGPRGGCVGVWGVRNTRTSRRHSGRLSATE